MTDWLTEKSSNDSLKNTSIIGHQNFPLGKSIFSSRYQALYIFSNQSPLPLELLISLTRRLGNFVIDSTPCGLLALQNGIRFGMRIRVMRNSGNFCLNDRPVSKSSYWRRQMKRCVGKSLSWRTTPRMNCYFDILSFSITVYIE